MKVRKSEKRIRYKVPNYRKVYTVYSYDRPKYSKIYKAIHNLAVKYDEKIFFRTNPYRVLDLCYIRDSNNQLVSYGDEKHIFRYKVYQNILREIADYLIIAYEILPNKDVLKYLFNRTHIILYYNNEYAQAQIYETIGKPLKLRLKTHIELLKQLQKGIEIETAMEFVRNKFNLTYIK